MSAKTGTLPKRCHLTVGHEACIGRGVYVTALIDREAHGEQTLHLELHQFGQPTPAPCITGVPLGSTFDVRGLQWPTRMRHTETQYDISGRISAVVLTCL